MAVASVVFGMVLLTFFHVWPYSKERKDLQTEVAALLQSHEDHIEKMSGSIVSERLSGLVAILEEPDFIDDLETRMIIHCE